MPAVPPSTSVIGFFLHLTGNKNDAKFCGDVAFWATRAPRGPADLVSDEDMALDGSSHPSGQRLDIYGKQERWTQCQRCERWYRLNLKHYRSIPHPADLGRLAAAERPVRGIDLRAHV